MQLVIMFWCKSVCRINNIYIQEKQKYSTLKTIISHCLGPIISTYKFPLWLKGNLSRVGWASGKKWPHGFCKCALLIALSLHGHLALYFPCVVTGVSFAYCDFSEAFSRNMSSALGVHSTAQLEVVIFLWKNKDLKIIHPSHPTQWISLTFFPYGR